MPRSETLLSGPDWQLLRAPLRPEGDTTAPDAAAAPPVGVVAVPGNVQVQLGFDDLWVDVPELGRVNHDEWLYVKRFAADPPVPGERAFLAFEGVDYFCDVWLNGHHVGHHEGQFTTF